MENLRPRIGNETVRSLAARVGCAEAHLHCILSSVKRPRKDLALRIEAATGGAIRAWELLGLPDGPAPVLPSHPDAA
jgi:hypothetical protein